MVYDPPSERSLPFLLAFANKKGEAVQRAGAVNRFPGINVYTVPIHLNPRIRFITISRPKNIDELSLFIYFVYLNIQGGW